MGSGIIGVGALLFLALSAVAAPLEIDSREVLSHRLSLLTPIRVEGPIPKTPVKVKVVVATDGKVTHAEAVGGPPEFYQQSVARVRSLQYRPFTQDGKIIEATFAEYVYFGPPEKWADVRVPFPEVQDWRSVRIILRRTACFGSCPVYSLEIQGDGTVEYTGGDFVLVAGKHTYQIPETMVRELVDLFRAADYFSMLPKYASRMSDLPSVITSLSIDGKTMSVLDYGGSDGEMPDVIFEIERSIDRACGIEKWKGGNSDTVPALRREKFDFRSKEAGRLLVLAANYSDAGVVQDLIDAGVPLSENAEIGIFSVFRWSITALSASASRGDERMVKALIAAGASKDDRSSKSEALIGAAEKGSLNIVRWLIGYGAEPGQSKIGVTFLMAAADSGIPAIVEEALKFRPEVNARDKSGETALYHASNDREGIDQPGNRAAIARLLIKAGAQVNIRAEQGNTALHETMDEGFARVLIKAGAKVSARNEDGETPLISTWDGNVARALIEAGADLDAKDGNGDTALDMARHNHLEDKVHVIEQALKARIKK